MQGGVRVGDEELTTEPRRSERFGASSDHERLSGRQTRSGKEWYQGAGARKVYRRRRRRNERDSRLVTRAARKEALHERRAHGMDRVRRYVKNVQVATFRPGIRL